MKKVGLKDLGIKNRSDGAAFLKRLWNGEKTNCPMCGDELEMLHRKAKKDSCEWQCRRCDAVFRTIDLLDQLNEQMPR